MKRILKYFGLALAVAAGFSCTREVILPEPVLEEGGIMIDVSSMPHTRAFDADDLASKGAEAYVNHIDLFIFGEQKDGGPSVYHERLSYASPADPDTKALGISKSQFISGMTYDVYVIANSTESVDNMSSVGGLDGLKELVQSDEYIYFTGLDQENVPEAFLMDASLEADLNPEGYESENTVLDVKLTRAAAKVVVELFEGTNDGVPVEFQSPDNTHVYHYRNLPYSTALLTGVEHTPALRSTSGHQVNDYVRWNKDAEGSLTVADGIATVSGVPQISVTGYVYAYDYKDQPMDKHTSLVVNIPIRIGEKDYSANYYKIPLTDGLKFERNRMYRIRASVNAPGAQTSFDPVEVTDLTYDVIEWNTYTPPISVGGNENKPQYLQLNTDHVDMYNVNTDATSLRFTSSSEITITLNRAYYVDYLDVERNLTGSLLNSIRAVAEPGALDGNITITSPFVNPDTHGNAIRYLEFTVSNRTGQTVTFTVSQYPTLYITNEHGHYSYRSDFGGTTYYERGTNRYNACYWDNNRWRYGVVTSNSSNYLFRSKFYNEDEGDIDYYFWNSSGRKDSYEAGSLTNPRMYHVHVTATSPGYVVAIPKRDANDYTIGTEENAKLVSPSFMIASQLGATQSPGSRQEAESHCSQYVEVKEDGVEYDDWRLPTEAEIEIIISHQYVSDAMAEVLSGRRYWSATGAVLNSGSDDTGNQTAVRCIRDVY